MNRHHRKYNRNQPHNQIRHFNFLAPTPRVNNANQNESSEAGNGKGNNNKQPPPKNKKTWQYADTIAVFALIVGIVMTVVTYNLFDISREQVQSVKDAGNAAKASATIAQQTFRETKTFDSITLANQKAYDIKMDSGNAKKLKRDTDFINKQKAGIDAQIAAFKEIKKESEPYLQIKFEGPITYSNGFIKFFYQIYNLGKFPAKASKLYINLDSRERKDSIKMEKELFEKITYKNMTDYITGFDPTIRTAYISHGFTEDYFNLFKRGAVIFFVGGEMIYGDGISTQKRIFKFMYQIRYTEGDNIGYTVIKNDNKLLK